MVSNQRVVGLPADRTAVVVPLHEHLRADVAHAHVSARHEERVCRLGHADHAFVSLLHVLLGCVRPVDLLDCEAQTAPVVLLSDQSKSLIEAVDHERRDAYCLVVEGLQDYREGSVALRNSLLRPDKRQGFFDSVIGGVSLHGSRTDHFRRRSSRIQQCFVSVIVVFEFDSQVGRRVQNFLSVLDTPHLQARSCGEFYVECQLSRCRVDINCIRIEHKVYSYLFRSATGGVEAGLQPLVAIQRTMFEMNLFIWSLEYAVLLIVLGA